MAGTHRLRRVPDVEQTVPLPAVPAQRRGRHRRPVPLAARLGTASLIVATIAAGGATVAAAPRVLAPRISEPPPAAVGLLTPTPAPALAAPRPSARGGTEAAAAPIPTPTPTPAPARPACADFGSRAAAQTALEDDPTLGALLDSDGDGRPCERRFPPPAPESAAAAAVAPTGGDTCPRSGFDGVRPHVAQAGHHLAARFDVDADAIGGVASRARTSYHPLGRALDFTVDRATGDALADYALDNATALGVIEVIWRQRINFGSGWEPMQDRGSVTANHYDHVHLSFRADADRPFTLTC